MARTGGRTERAGGTRCPFDRSLHSLCAPLVSVRKTKRVKEKSKRERERQIVKRGWIACQYHVYSAARTIRTRSTVLDTNGVSKSRIKAMQHRRKYLLIMHPFSNFRWSLWHARYTGACSQFRSTFTRITIGQSVLHDFSMIKVKGD